MGKLKEMAVEEGSATKENPSDAKPSTPAAKSDESKGTAETLAAGEAAAGAAAAGEAASGAAGAGATDEVCIVESCFLLAVSPECYLVDPFLDVAPFMFSIYFAPSNGQRDFNVINVTCFSDVLNGLSYMSKHKTESNKGFSRLVDLLHFSTVVFEKKMKKLSSYKMNFNTP